MSSIGNHDKSIFVIKGDICCFFEEGKTFKFSKEVFDHYFQNKLISVFSDSENNFFCLINDLTDINLNTIHFQKKDLQKTLLDNKLKPNDSNLCFSTGLSTTIKISNVDNHEPAAYAALRNLLTYCKTNDIYNLKSNEEINFLDQYIVITSNKQILKFVNAQIGRIKSLKQNKVSIFANTAHYMGSKKNLGPFLVEVISRVLPKEGIVIDLMCGSGAASQAFSNNWKTYASDVQKFSQYLALIQGKGYNRTRANQLLKKLEPNINKNKDELNKLVSPWVNEEDVLFHSKIDEILFHKYKEFIERSQSYPIRSTSQISQKLNSEIFKRKIDPTIFPYCLFTAYFANVYFGFRQSLEIDSIRYAIDQLDDEYDKKWALGTLVATLSHLGSGYAAQFAQPVEPTQDKIPELFEQRAKSVFHEFSRKLSALSQESETAKNKIEILPGPWENTLIEAVNRINSDKVVVYLDAPYKREEYSRYYHVLETMIVYNYPSAILKGKLPDKISGERFKSAFFTKTSKNIEDEFVKIIKEILCHGWICAWSYSDNGAVKIKSIVNRVYEDTKCDIISYPTPYQHKAQGKRKGKMVIEYCILFSPPHNTSLPLKEMLARRGRES